MSALNTLLQPFKVLWSPRETLSSVARQPRLIAPLLLLTFFAALDTTVVFSTLDPGQLRLEQFEREGYADKISDSDKAVLAQNARDRSGLAVAVTVISEPLIVLVTAGLFFLLLGAGRGAGFVQFLSVTAFAFMPSIAHTLASIVTVSVRAPTIEVLQRAASTGPLRFVDPVSTSQGLRAFLSLLDLASLWVVALLVIGYGFVPGTPRRAGVRVLAVAGVYAAWSVGFSLLQSMLS